MSDLQVFVGDIGGSIICDISCDIVLDDLSCFLNCGSKNCLQLFQIQSLIMDGKKNMPIVFCEIISDQHFLIKVQNSSVDGCLFLSPCADKW